MDGYGVGGLFGVCWVFGIDVGFEKYYDVVEVELFLYCIGCVEVGELVWYWCCVVCGDVCG